MPAGVRPVLPQPLVARVPRRWRRRAVPGRAALAGSAAVALAAVLAGCAAAGGTECHRRVGRPVRHRLAAGGSRSADLQLRNAGTGAAGVDLIDPATGAVYAEAAVVGPGSTRPLRVNLGTGRYAFHCLLPPGGSRTGPVVRIGGHRRGATAVLPVTTADLAARPGPTAATSPLAWAHWPGGSTRWPRRSAPGGWPRPGPPGCPLT